MEGQNSQKKNASVCGWHFFSGVVRIREAACALSDRGLRCLTRHDQASVIAFWSLMDIELNLLASLQCSVSLHLNRGVVCEDILAAADRTDKPEAFGVVEPFYCTRLHAFTSLARHFDK
jgi:hypothetical protein